MKRTMLPITTLGGLTLAAVFGITTVGRIPHAQGTTAPVYNAAPVPEKPVRATKVVKTSTSPAKSGEDSTDPVVHAGDLAKAEAETVLQNQICDFLVEYGQNDPTWPRGKPRLPPANTGYCSDLNPAVRPKIIVAVLPDPVHTQLALRFDEATDELQNSMQDLGWTYDRAWLPWDNRQREEATDFDQRMENRRSQEWYELSPGAIMFRGSAGKGTKQPLVVLVAGDTPTGGVNALQFRNAIKIWQQLTKAEDSAGSTEPKELSILGPTYTGSVPSLKRLLVEVTGQYGGTRKIDPTADGSYLCPTDRKLNIFIASGTVRGSVESLAPGKPGECLQLDVEPRSFGVDIAYEYNRVGRFLAEHHAHIQWASLTEAESLFGSFLTQEFAKEAERTLDFVNKEITGLKKSVDVINNAIQKEIDQNKKLKQSNQKDPIIIEGQREKGDLLYKIESDQQEAEYLRHNTRPAPPPQFYFPRGISRLRTAYEKNGIFGFSTESSTERTQLHLSLGDNTSEDDTIHSFSGSQDAAAQEAEMASLAAELERQKTDLVLLTATNVLDEIFVCRYLAQHAPNVAVILVDSDKLFLRGGDSSLENTFIVDAWPLIPGNQHWSAPPKQTDLPKDSDLPKEEDLPPVRIHDSGGGEGLYTATRLLVCDLDDMKLDGCGAVPGSKGDPPNPAQRVSMREYQPPVATWAANSDDLKSEPPLWLSAVGNGGFWPIALVDVDQAQYRLPSSTSFNLPPILQVSYGEGEVKQPFPAVRAQGIIEGTPRSVLVATGVIALILLWQGMAIFRARLDRSFAWSYALSDAEHHLPRLALEAAIMLMAIPALTLLKTPIEPGSGVVIRGSGYTFFNWALQMVAVLLASWPALLLLRCQLWPEVAKKKLVAPRWPAMQLRSELWPKEQKESQILGLKMMGVWVLAGLFVWLVNARLWDLIAPPVTSFPTERSFFYYRSGHLFCGSSPVLPLLLLGLALVVAMTSTFDRLVFYRHRIPVLPISAPELRCPDPRWVATLNGLLSRIPNKLRLALFGAVAVLLLIIVGGLNDVVPRSLAHGRFDVVVAVLSGIVTILMLHDLAMAVVAWLLLRSDCLLPLSRSPLRWGFTWIKGFSWQRIWAPGEMSQEFIFEYLPRLLEANRRSLQSFAPANNSPLPNVNTKEVFETAKAVDEYVQRMRAKFLERPMPDGWSTQVTRRLGRVHYKLAAAASAKLKLLQTMWESEHGPLTGDEPERGLSAEISWDKLSTAATDRNEWTAAHERAAMEEFVALLYLG